MDKNRTAAEIVLLLIALIGHASIAEAGRPGCDRRNSAKFCRPPDLNHAPTISGVPPASVTSGQNYLFQPSIADAEGDPLTVNVANLPPWASINTSTGRIAGTPGPSDVGEHIDIRISVSDGVSSASLPAFSIEVQAATTQYQVAVTVAGPGSVVDAGHGISCRTSCSYTFAGGTTLNLTASPEAGAHFESWAGSCSSSSSCTVVIPGSMSLTATFAADSPPPPPLPPSEDALRALMNYAETWDRNWNFGGHSVTSAFTESYGRWDYTNTTYEPWLFDRATVGYRLYELTGDTRWRDKFLSDFAWYRARIDANGIFTPKGGGDTKYGYVTPFVLYERLTGDPQYRPIAKRVFDSWVREWSTSFLPDGGAGLWTEREMAFALEAAIGWYELSGEAAALNRASAIVHQWKAASGSVGAPLVTYTQHEGGGPGGTTPQNLTNSPWMSALYFQALRRYFSLTNDAEALAQVARYADWCENNCFYDAALVHPEYSGLVFPRYLTGELIGDAGYDYGNMGHCLDVQGLLRFAIFAKQQRAESSTAVQNRYAQMQTCAQRDFEEWTRDTVYLPKYRINPPRKFNWQLRGYYEIAQ